MLAPDLLRVPQSSSGDSDLLSQKDDSLKFVTVLLMDVCNTKLDSQEGLPHLIGQIPQQLNIWHPKRSLCVSDKKRATAVFNIR